MPVRNHTILTTLLSIGLATALAGCDGAAGMAGQALAGSAATGMMASGSNKARFTRQSCDELKAEIASAKRGMINPLTIPSTQAYIKDAQEVAASKGCAV